MNFIIGRSNLSCTIFVPYDCSNNCYFCTTKKEYADTSNFSIDRIIESIRVINNTSIKEIVITGGEPFANLILLGRILDAIDILDVKVFINTSLPISNDAQFASIYNFLSEDRYRSKIACLNISRHINYVTKDNNVFLLDFLPVPYRINSVLPADISRLDPDKVLKFIYSFKKATVVQFREDYRKTNFNNLKTLDNAFIDFAVNKMGANYIGSHGCQVCNNDDFIVRNHQGVEKIITLHRGTENSSITVGNTTVVNDIIIKQDGKMYYDWDLKQAHMKRLLETLGYRYRIKAKNATTYTRHQTYKRGIINEEESRIYRDSNNICNYGYSTSVLGRCGGGGRC